LAEHAFEGPVKPAETKDVMSGGDTFGFAQTVRLHEAIIYANTCVSPVERKCRSSKDQDLAAQCDKVEKITRSAPAASVESRYGILMDAAHGGLGSRLIGLRRVILAQKSGNLSS